jgi:hypothetical protein
MELTAPVSYAALKGTDALFGKMLYKKSSICSRGTMKKKLLDEGCDNPLIYGWLQHTFFGDPNGNGQYLDTYIFRCDAGSKLCLESGQEIVEGSMKMCYYFWNWRMKNP